MTALPIILSIALASSDGGVVSDRPVVEVRSAEEVDGGTLPDGWWVSRPQMKKLGDKLVECENCQKAAVTEPVEGGMCWGFWAGMALGSTATAVAIVAVSSLLGGR